VLRCFQLLQGCQADASTGGSGLVDETEAPIYLTVRALGGTSGGEKTSYDLGAMLYDYDNKGNLILISTVTPQDLTFTQTYEHVLNLGKAKFGQRLVIAPFLKAVAGTGGTFDALPQRRAGVTAIFNLASSVRPQQQCPVHQEP
jgi:hypothetical protein